MAFGDIRTLSRIDCIFSIYLWLRHVIPISHLMLLRTLGRELFRVTTLQYVSSSSGLLVVGWLGRSTTLHCMHHVLTCRLKDTRASCLFFQ